MAIAFDAATGMGFGFVTTATVAHTCTGSDRILIVATANQQGGISITSITYNSVALTFIRADDGATGARSEIWYLLAPSTGANNIIVTPSGGGTRLAVGAISLTGVTQSSPIGATNGATGSGTGPSVALTTTVANSWIVSNCASEGDTVTSTPGANETERYQANGSSSPAASRSNVAGNTEVSTTTGSYTMSNTLSASVDFGLSAIEIKEATVSTSVYAKNIIAGVFQKTVLAGITLKEID
jgi:hypothetical protein